MADGFPQIVQLAREYPELVPLVKAIHDVVDKGGNEFSLPGVAPQLRELKQRGIAANADQFKRGNHVYYLVDPDGIKRGLKKIEQL